MAEESWPFDDGSGAYATEDQWRAFARNFAKTGMVGARWTSTGSVNQSGLISAGTGRQVIRAAAPQGAYVDGIFWRDNSSMTLTPDENESTSPRVDRVVLRLDPTDNEITTEIVKGTPGTALTPPSLTRSSTGIFECPIGRYTMPGSASAQVPINFVDERRWTVPTFGGKVGYGSGMAINPGATGLEQAAGRQHIPAFAGEILEVTYTSNIRVEGTERQGISWGVSGVGLEAVESIPTNHFYRQIPNASGVVDWFPYHFSWRYYVISDFPWVGIAVQNRGLTSARIIVGSTNYQIKIL